MSPAVLSATTFWSFLCKSPLGIRPSKCSVDIFPPHGNPGNCADENQDTLSVESVFWMVLAFGGGYDQSNTEEGAHHRQAE
jgi:hypothetical protein